MPDWIYDRDIMQRATGRPANHNMALDVPEASVTRPSGIEFTQMMRAALPVLLDPMPSITVAFLI